MNLFERFQHTQETLQGGAERLRIDFAGLTLPDLAGVVTTEAIKLHDDLVNVRTSLGEMERQRDDARRELATEGAEMADALGKVKALVESQGVPVGEYWSDIPLAVDTMIAEAPTKPRRKVGPASGPCPMRDQGLPHVLRGGESWCFYCGENGTKPREIADQGRDIITPGIDGCSACLDRLHALTARAEKAEQGLERMRLLRDEAREETASADRATAEREEMITRRDNEIAALTSELARFQRADVGERVREIEGLHATAVEASAIKHRPGLVNVANDRHRHRAELLSIVRQQAAEIERLHKNLTAVGAILGRGWEETHEQAALGVAMHGVFSRSAARIWKRAAKKLYAETGRNAEQWVRDQVRIADMQRCRLATENCLTESRAECNRLHAHLSAIRERVEGIPTYGFTDPGRVALVVRSEVLSALELSGNPGELAQPLEKFEKFRQGLPVLALRRVCSEWDACDRHRSEAAGQICKFSGEVYRFTHWLNPEQAEPLSDYTWKGWRFRPHGKTWADVYIAAAEMLGREDAKEQRPQLRVEQLASALGVDLATPDVLTAYRRAYDKAASEAKP